MELELELELELEFLPIGPWSSEDFYLGPDLDAPYWLFEWFYLSTTNSLSSNSYSLLPLDLLITTLSDYPPL